MLFYHGRGVASNQRRTVAENIAGKCSDNRGLSLTCVGLSLSRVLPVGIERSFTTLPIPCYPWRKGACVQLGVEAVTLHKQRGV